MVKTKSYDNFIEGFSDSAGTIKSVHGFIKAWKTFDEKKSENMPALKRYLVEFINETLGLLYRYSEKQRNLDANSLLSKKKWWKIW